MPRSASEILASPFFTGLTRLQRDVTSYFAGLGELRADIESLVALESDLATARAALETAATEASADAEEITRLNGQVTALTAELAAARARIAELLPPPPVFLSDRVPSSARNGWGPFERDRANGEQGASDGPPLAIRGVTYAKGLGVHAPSSLTYNIGRLYSRFQSVIGVADYVGDAASVIFRVVADGAEIFRSAVLTRTSAAVTVDVSVAGVSTLELIVDPNGSTSWDNANWADAKLIPLTSAPTAMPPTYIVLEGAAAATPPPPPPPPPSGGALQPLNIVGWNLTVDDVGLRGAGVDPRLTSEGGDLTLYTGPFVIPANTVLDRFLFRGAVRIINPGIVIQRSLFAPTGQQQLPLVECRNRDTWTATVHQSIVQNCEFTGEFTATQQQRAFMTAWFGPGTFLRNYVHAIGGGIACYGNGTQVDILIEENIVGDPAQQAASGGFTRDMQGFGSWATSGNHSSAFTIRDFRLSARPDRTLIVRRNRFFDVGPNTSGPFTMYGQEGPIDGNVFIEQNLITGNGWKVNISPNPNAVRNLTFTDNRMERGPGSHFGWFSTSVTGMVRTDNYELDRAQPLQRGALIP